ncbi:hypothetical protein SK128_023207 [Halocaridina rubra]|uniref:Protein kinase domain-containing protein n=1 Tax=Halocaridina rubra TaxID=373956 RepID=A0AAN8X8A7_HALRR
MLYNTAYSLAVSHFWGLSRHLHNWISLVSQFFYTQESNGLHNFRNFATKDTRSAVSNAGMIPEDDPKPEEETCSEDHGSVNIEEQTSHMDVIKNASESSREDDPSPCNHDGIILQIEEMMAQLPDETPSCQKYGSENVVPSSPAEDQNASLERDESPGKDIPSTYKYGGNTVQNEEVRERNESNVADTNVIDFHDIDIQYLDKEELCNRLELVGRAGFEGKSALSKVLFDGKLSMLKENNSKTVSVKEMQILKYLNGVGGAPKLLAATQSSFVHEIAGSYSFLDQICNHFSVKDNGHYNTLYKVLSVVKELHAMGISHNNLAPNNIMVDAETGKIKIVDFSRACKMGETGPFEYDRPKGYKSIYMIPEYDKGQQVTPTSDVYTLGVILAFIFCRYSSESKNPIIKRLIGSALSKDPQMRPSLDEFATVLKYAHKYENTRKYKAHGKTMCANIKSKKMFKEVKNVGYFDRLFKRKPSGGGSALKAQNNVCERFR